MVDRVPVHPTAIADVDSYREVGPPATLPAIRMRTTILRNLGREVDHLLRDPTAVERIPAPEGAMTPKGNNNRDAVAPFVGLKTTIHPSAPVPLLPALAMVVVIPITVLPLGSGLVSKRR